MSQLVDARDQLARFQTRLEAARQDWENALFAVRFLEGIVGESTPQEAASGNGHVRDLVEVSAARTTREAIRRVMQARPDHEWRSVEVRALLEQADCAFSKAAVETMLRRMAAEGEIVKSGRGRFHLRRGRG